MKIKYFEDTDTALVELFVVFAQQNDRHRLAVQPDLLWAFAFGVDLNVGIDQVAQSTTPPPRLLVRSRSSSSTP